MNLTPEELKYLKYVLSCTSSYAIAKGEQLDTPSVSHKRLIVKIEDELGRRHWK